MTSLDDVGVVGYSLYQDGVAAGSTTSTAFTFSGLACGTTHALAVDAVDAAGNRSAQGGVTWSTAACDTVPPTVAITAPADTSTVGGSVTVTADAADDVALTGVQLRLDGAALGAALTAPPYSTAWNTALIANGQHVLSAVATDSSGNTATSAPVTVTVANAAPATPTPVPAAGDPGGHGRRRPRRRVDQRGHPHGGQRRLRDRRRRRSVSGSDLRPRRHPRLPRDRRPGGERRRPDRVRRGRRRVNRPVSRGAGDCTYSVRSVLQSPDVRLDSSGVAHVTYIDGFDGAVYYQTFSTVTDTWGPRTTIGANGQLASAGGATWPREGNVALTLDAADQPHVVYMTNGTANQIVETARSGGVWSAATTIATGSTAIHPSLATAVDGSIHLAWVTNSFSASPTIMYARRSGAAWTAPEAVSAGDTKVLSDANSDQGPSVATDAAGQPYVMYMDGTASGADDYVRLRYRTTVGAWTDNTPPGGAGGASNPSAQLFAHTPQVYISGTGGVYAVLGHDVHVQYGYQYQLGGVGTAWAPYATLDPRSATSPGPGDTVEPGTDGSASIRFDPLRDTNPGIIDTLYFDERDNADAAHHHATAYYKAIVIGASGSGPRRHRHRPPADTVPPSVSMTAPAAGASVSGSAVTVSANASDDTGVAGVQFLLDGASLGTEDTASPYSVTWNASAATAGTHQLAARARDAAGNVTTSAAVTVTVTAAAGGQLMLGTKTLSSNGDSVGAGQAEAFRATASLSGALGSVTVYLATGTLATRVVFGVYANAAGHPGALLGQATLTGPVAGAWNTVPIGGVSLQSGSTYWIALLGPDGTVNFRDVAGGGASETSTSTTLTTLPATWSTGHAWTDGQLSAYGSS